MSPKIGFQILSVYNVRTVGLFTEKKIGGVSQHLASLPGNHFPEMFFYSVLGVKYRFLRGQRILDID